MNPATEILLSAAFALTPKENWTQRVLARDKKGGAIPSASPLAASWCVVGAICEAENALNLFDFTTVTDALRAACGENVVNFNNMRTHAEIIDALYRAAELAETSSS